MKHWFLPSISGGVNRLVVGACLVLLAPYTLMSVVWPIVGGVGNNDSASFWQALAEMELLDFWQWVEWSLFNLVFLGPSCVPAIIFVRAQRKSHRVGAAFLALLPVLVLVICNLRVLVRLGDLLECIVELPMKCAALIETIWRNTAHRGEDWLENYLFYILVSLIGVWALLWAIVLAIEIAKRPVVEQEQQETR